MSEVTDIKAGIKSICVSTLGSSYSELSYTMDVEKNNFKGNTNRYGVLAGALDQNEGRGCMGKYTVDQVYTIKFTDSYGSKPTSDEAQVATIDDLLNKALVLYKNLVNNQAGAPSVVTMVENLRILEPKSIEGSNLVVITMEINITYRKVL